MKRVKNPHAKKYRPSSLNALFTQFQLKPLLKLSPLGSSFGGNTFRGRHSAAAVLILHRAISGVEHNQSRNAAHAELRAKGLDLVSCRERHREKGHGAIVFLERVSIAVTGGEHDGQSTGVFFLELLVELAQSGSESAARRALF